MNLAIRVVIAAAIVALLVWTSRILDRKWREKHPEEQPFAWGYFQALLFFPTGLLWFALPFMHEIGGWQSWVYMIVYGVVGSVAGYALIKKKKRWAWVFVVVAQLNLATWLIDIYYGGNRWKEFR